MKMICKAVGHRIDRRAVAHDGTCYWTGCTRCRTPLVRDVSGWRRPTMSEIISHAAAASGEAALGRFAS